jgi:glycosyltransferase involved in cell wall biosynthesis
VRSASDPRRAIILTSYRTGAPRGKNLGVPGYSYDLVAQLFVPLLARWGEVVPVVRYAEAVESAVQDARRRGLNPVHISFVPCQDMVFASSAPNVIVPAWEFPDVPNEAFEGKPQNNWVAVANRCDLVLVGGQFTVDSFQRAGIRTPIRVVPVPTPPEYFEVPRWSVETTTRLACPAYVFPKPDVPAHELWDAPSQCRTQNAECSMKDKGRLNSAFCILHSALREWRAWLERLELIAPPLLTQVAGFVTERLRTDRWQSYVRRCRRESVELSGVVYTCIFNPHDGRKNWQDLLTGFVSALHDCPDATLVIKLITAERLMVDRVLDFYRSVGLSHRCKIIFITDYLTDEQMLALMRASTYYLTTTRAEGNCLPLMNYLAAGRPGIAPCHTALADYFDEDMGLTIPWHAEPAAWPQDNRARLKTTWARLDWPRLVERLRESSTLALNDRSAYDARADRARRRLRERASVESVQARLHTALAYLDEVRSRDAQAA